MIILKIYIYIYFTLHYAQFNMILLTQIFEYEMNMKIRDDIVQNPKSQWQVKEVKIGLELGKICQNWYQFSRDQNWGIQF